MNLFMQSQTAIAIYAATIRIVQLFLSPCFTIIYNQFISNFNRQMRVYPSKIIILTHNLQYVCIKIDICDLLVIIY